MLYRHMYICHDRVLLGEVRRVQATEMLGTSKVVVRGFPLDGEWVLDNNTKLLAVDHNVLRIWRVPRSQYVKDNSFFIDYKKVHLTFTKD